MDFTQRMALWTRGVASQAAFWTVWAKTKGYKWPDEFTARSNPHLPLDPAIAALIPADAISCKILDVGAGPLTCVGKMHSGITLEVQACDPLAKIYSALMQINGIVPVVETKFANAENLSAFYPDNHFDITHCRNALDHSLDPMGGLIEMLRITKVGGYVVLDHELNEGVNAKYAGFHQYNFDIQDGRFIIWNPSLRIDVQEVLPVEATIELAGPDANGMFKAIIHKTGDFADADPSGRVSRRFAPQMAEILEYLFDQALGEGLRQQNDGAETLSA